LARAFRFQAEESSGLTTPKKFGGLAQLARASALHAEGHRFDSDILHQLETVLLIDFMIMASGLLIRNQIISTLISSDLNPDN
jgi:hypothetical protein